MINNNFLNRLKKDVTQVGNPQKAKLFQRFFKTGKGEYAEGDLFLGLTVPQQREVAKKYHDLKLTEVEKLLKSKIHEHRLIALIILVNQFKKADDQLQVKIKDIYLQNTKRINNWDLVDLSASYILGNYYLKKDKTVLYRLARSENLWEKRIAIISTFAFIRQGLFEDTIKIAEILLKDPHDLIHKAVGWMLREMGKKDQKLLEKFLDKHGAVMPRTMLRYAIEKFDEEKRRYYLKKI